MKLTARQENALSLMAESDISEGYRGLVRIDTDRWVSELRMQTLKRLQELNLVRWRYDYGVTLWSITEQGRTVVAGLASRGA